MRNDRRIKKEEKYKFETGVWRELLVVTIKCAFLLFVFVFVFFFFFFKFVLRGARHRRERERGKQKLPRGSGDPVWQFSGNVHFEFD